MTMTMTTIAQMHELHRELVRNLREALDPSKARRKPGVELFAVTGALLRQEGVRAGSKRSQKLLQQLDVLYMQRLAEGLRDNPSASLAAEVGKLLRHHGVNDKTGRDGIPITPSALADMNLPFSA